MTGQADGILGSVTHLVSPQQRPALRMSDAPLELYEKLPHRCDPWDIVKPAATARGGQGPVWGAFLPQST